MDHEMVTTAFDIDGYRVVKTLGVVRGITVRSRSLVGNIGAALQSLVGGNITLYTELCERAREEAFDLMVTDVVMVESGLVMMMVAGERHLASVLAQV